MAVVSPEEIPASRRPKRIISTEEITLDKIKHAAANTPKS